MESLATRFQRQRWVLLYERVVSEVDDCNRLDLIAATTGAIFQRKRQLLQSKLAHIDELPALDAPISSLVCEGQQSSIAGRGAARTKSG
jgi:hypothetical protein